MRKLSILILILNLLLTLCACSKEKDNTKTKIDSLPNEFYACQDGLLLKVDYFEAHNNPNAIYNPTQALAYENGNFYSLDSKDVEITVESKHVIGENEEINLNIKYYVYEDTVHAFLVGDLTQIYSDIMLQSIPKNPESIIIHNTSALKKPLICNLKDKTCKPLYDTDCSFLECISKDGKYTAVKTSDDNQNYLIIDLNDNKNIKIPLPTEQDKDTKTTLNAIGFTGDKFIFKLGSNKKEYAYKGLYEFDIKNNKLAKMDIKGDFSNFSKGTNTYGDCIIVNEDTKKGVYSVLNLETKEQYEYTFKRPTNFSFITNQNCQYAFGSYAYYGEPVDYVDGEAFYSTPQDYIDVIVNLKNGKSVKKENIVKKPNIENYSNSILQWLNESEILVTHLSGLAGDLSFKNEIINVEDIGELK